MHILPEFEEGGVERHVLLLATELEKRGHSLCVVSHGGKLSALLPLSVQQCVLPVHRKNPVIALFCAFKLARMVRAQRWELYTFTPVFPHGLHGLSMRSPVFRG